MTSLNQVQIEGIFNKLISLGEKFENVDHNNWVLFLKIKHQRAEEGKEKEILEEKLLTRFQGFEENKNKFLDTLDQLKNVQSNLKEEEDLTYYNNMWERNCLSFHQFESKSKIDDKKTWEYLNFQEEMWSELLTSLDKTRKQGAPMQKGDLNENKETETLEENEVKQRKLELKIKMCEDECAQATDDQIRGSKTALKMLLEDLRQSQKEIREMIYDPDIIVTEEISAVISGAKMLMRNIAQQIENLEDQEEKAAQLEKTEIAMNLRALEAVKLVPLTGPEDFIQWKKSQKYINSHTNGYKKSAALLATLKNPDDRMMCGNLTDYNKIMTLLNEKYNHENIILVNMKIKLEGLPKAESDEEELELIRTVLNTYEQMRSLDAEKQFDGSLIYNIAQKLTDSSIVSYQRFKMEREELEALQAGVDLTYDEDGIQTSSPEVKRDPLETRLEDNTAKEKELFLEFLGGEAKILEFLQVE